MSCSAGSDAAAAAAPPGAAKSSLPAEDAAARFSFARRVLCALRRLRQLLRSRKADPFQQGSQELHEVFPTGQLDLHAAASFDRPSDNGASLALAALDSTSIWDTARGSAPLVAVEGLQLVEATLLAATLLALLPALAEAHGLGPQLHGRHGGVRNAGRCASRP